MHHVIRLFEPLLRLLLPGSGRRRSAGASHAGVYADVPPTPEPRYVPARGWEPLWDEDAALVRPYVLPPEQREERRAQQGQRRPLWLVVQRYEAETRWIDALEVAS